MKRESIRSHRAMVRRLEAWADQLDICPVISRGLSMADELRNRMRGGK